jgi:hypothetical protein
LNQAVRGCTLDEADADERLAALEAVLPRHDQPQWRAVLRRQHFAVHPEGKHRQRVLCLVHAQAFDIRPLEHPRRDAGHRLRIGQGVELDELGVAGGLYPA